MSFEFEQAEAMAERHMTPAQWRRQSRQDRAEMLAQRRLAGLMRAIEDQERRQKAAMR